MRCNTFSQSGCRFVSMFVVALFVSGIVESAQAVSLFSSRVISQTSPVLYWDLDETIGTTAGDLSSINGSNTGTYINSTLGSTGPRPVDGFLGMNDNNIGPSVAKSGKAQIIDLETVGMVGTAAYSAQVWFNSSAAFNTQVLNYVMERGIDTTSTGRRDSIGVGGNWTGGTVTNVLFGNKGGGGAATNGTTVLSPNTWYSMVMVRDDALASAQLKFYLNGNTIPEIVIDGAWAGGVGDFFAAGNRTDGNTGLGLTGTFDEVAVWDYALSATQVEALYNASLYGPVPEPSSLSMLGLGMLGLLRHARRRGYHGKRT